MPEIRLSRTEEIVRSKIQHYDADKYWRYRKLVIENLGGCSLLYLIGFAFCT